MSIHSSQYQANVLNNFRQEIHQEKLPQFAQIPPEDHHHHHQQQRLQLMIHENNDENTEVNNFSHSDASILGIDAKFDNSTGEAFGHHDGTVGTNFSNANNNNNYNAHDPSAFNNMNMMLYQQTPTFITAPTTIGHEQQRRESQRRTTVVSNASRNTTDNDDHLNTTSNRNNDDDDDNSFVESRRSRNNTNASKASDRKNSAASTSGASGSFNEYNDNNKEDDHDAVETKVKMSQSKNSKTAKNVRDHVNNNNSNLKVGSPHAAEDARSDSASSSSSSTNSASTAASSLSWADRAPEWMLNLYDFLFLSTVNPDVDSFQEIMRKLVWTMGFIFSPGMVAIAIYWLALFIANGSAITSPLSSSHAGDAYAGPSYGDGNAVLIAAMSSFALAGVVFIPAWIYLKCTGEVPSWLLGWWFVGIPLTFTGVSVGIPRFPLLTAMHGLATVTIIMDPDGKWVWFAIANIAYLIGAYNLNFAQELNSDGSPFFNNYQPPPRNVSMWNASPALALLSPPLRNFDRSPYLITVAVPHQGSYGELLFLVLLGYVIQIVINGGVALLGVEHERMKSRNASTSTTGQLIADRIDSWDLDGMDAALQDYVDDPDSDLAMHRHLTSIVTTIRDYCRLVPRKMLTDLKERTGKCYDFALEPKMVVVLYLKIVDFELLCDLESQRLARRKSIIEGKSDGKKNNSDAKEESDQKKQPQKRSASSPSTSTVSNPTGSANINHRGSTSQIRGKETSLTKDGSLTGHQHPSHQSSIGVTGQNQNLTGGASVLPHSFNFSQSANPSTVNHGTFNHNNNSNVTDLFPIQSQTSHGNTMSNHLVPSTKQSQPATLLLGAGMQNQNSTFVNSNNNSSNIINNNNNNNKMKVGGLSTINSNALTNSSIPTNNNNNNNNNVNIRNNIGAGFIFVDTNTGQIVGGFGNNINNSNTAEGTIEKRTSSTTSHATTRTATATASNLNPSNNELGRPTSVAVPEDGRESAQQNRVNPDGGGDECRDSLPHQLLETQQQQQQQPIISMLVTPGASPARDVLGLQQQQRLRQQQQQDISQSNKNALMMLVDEPEEMMAARKDSSISGQQQEVPKINSQIKNNSNNSKPTKSSPTSTSSTGECGDDDDDDDGDEDSHDGENNNNNNNNNISGDDDDDDANNMFMPDVLKETSTANQDQAKTDSLRRKQKKGKRDKKDRKNKEKDREEDNNKKGGLMRDIIKRKRREQRQLEQQQQEQHTPGKSKNRNNDAPDDSYYSTESDSGKANVDNSLQTASEEGHFSTLSTNDFPHPHIRIIGASSKRNYKRNDNNKNNHNHDISVNSSFGRRANEMFQKLDDDNDNGNNNDNETNNTPNKTGSTNQFPHVSNLPANQRSTINNNNNITFKTASEGTSDNVGGVNSTPTGRTPSAVGGSDISGEGGQWLPPSTPSDKPGAVVVEIEAAPQTHASNNNNHNSKRATSLPIAKKKTIAIDGQLRQKQQQEQRQNTRNLEAEKQEDLFSNNNHPDGDDASGTAKVFSTHVMRVYEVASSLIRQHHGAVLSVGELALGSGAGSTSLGAGEIVGIWGGLRHCENAATLACCAAIHIQAFINQIVGPAFEGAFGDVYRDIQDEMHREEMERYENETLPEYHRKADMIKKARQKARGDIDSVVSAGANRDDDNDQDRDENRFDPDKWKKFGGSEGKLLRSGDSSSSDDEDDEDDRVGAVEKNDDDYSYGGKKNNNNNFANNNQELPQNEEHSANKSNPSFNNNKKQPSPVGSPSSAKKPKRKTGLAPPPPPPPPPPPTLNASGQSVPMPFNIAMACHRGLAMVGNVGSETRQVLTAEGDATEVARVLVQAMPKYLTKPSVVVSADCLAEANNPGSTVDTKSNDITSKILGSLQTTPTAPQPSSSKSKSSKKDNNNNFNNNKKKEFPKFATRDLLPFRVAPFVTRGSMHQLVGIAAAAATTLNDSLLSSTRSSAAASSAFLFNPTTHNTNEDSGMLLSGLAIGADADAGGTTAMRMNMKNMNIKDISILRNIEQNNNKINKDNKHNNDRSGMAALLDTPICSTMGSSVTFGQQRLTNADLNETNNNENINNNSDTINKFGNMSNGIARNTDGNIIVQVDDEDDDNRGKQKTSNTNNSNKNENGTNKNNGNDDENPTTTSNDNNEDNLAKKQPLTHVGKTQSVPIDDINRTLTESFRFLRKKFSMDYDSTEKLRLVNAALQFFVGGNFARAASTYDQSLEQIDAAWRPILANQGIHFESTTTMRDRCLALADKYLPPGVTSNQYHHHQHNQFGKAQNQKNYHPQLKKPLNNWDPFVDLDSFV